MASQARVGRNDRCPCGSGKKYKNCCAEKTARKMSPLSWAAIVALVAAAGVLVALALDAARGGGRAAAPGSQVCPPGQIWDAAHGHCH